MSATSSFLAHGDCTLLALSGEELEFRSEKVTCVVNWLTSELAAKRYPQFTERIESTVFIRSSDVSLLASDDEPKAGEAFKDGQGNYHRILNSTHDGAGWLCACSVERAS